MSENRIKVSIYFLDEPNFNEIACKYTILYLNSLQSTFEFQFPTNKSYLDSYNITEEQKGLIEKLSKKDPNFQNLSEFFRFENLLDENDFTENATYHVGIIKKPLENNLFFVSWYNKSIITTNRWDKLFSPPSVFEYVIHCLNASLIHFATSTSIGSHGETRSCVLDYTSFKEERKVDIALGYICDDCSARIKEKLGEEFLQSIKKISSRDWIGRVDEPDSFAYNLKKYFKVDIEEDSGFNKGFWEKAKEHFTELPKELTIIVLTVLITVIVTLYVTSYFTGE